MNGYDTNYLSCKSNVKLDRRLKAVIGYWTDYYEGRDERRIWFKVNKQNLIITYDAPYYEIHYKWLTTRVHNLNIFETLDLYEDMMKGMN